MAASIALTPGLGAAQATPSAAHQSLAVDSLVPAPLRELLYSTSPELAARRASLAAAEARLRAVGFAPPAVLSVELEDVPSGRFDEGSLRLDVSREFLSGGRRAAARAAAAADVRVAEAALRVTERRVAAAALRALTQFVGWRAVADRLAAQDSLLGSTEVSLRTRFAVGGARYVDVLRLRTERLRVQNDRAAALAEARIGSLSLLALLAGGADSVAAGHVAWLDSLVVDEASPFARGELPPVPTVEALVAASGLMDLADAELAQATAARQIVRAGQRPQLSAGIGVQRMGGDDPAFGPTLGVALSLPFTARRSYEAQALAADRAIEAATAGRRATLGALRGGLAAAHARYEAARGRLAVYDAALLRGAREERESALAAYRTGDLSLLELLDFERALSNAELERTRAIIDAAGALADLFSGLLDSAEPLRSDLPPFVQVTNER